MAFIFFTLLLHSWTWSAALVKTPPRYSSVLLRIFRKKHRHFEYRSLVEKHTWKDTWRVKIISHLTHHSKIFHSWLYVVAHLLALIQTFGAWVQAGVKPLRIVRIWWDHFTEFKTNQANANKQIMQISHNISHSYLYMHGLFWPS